MTGQNQSVHPDIGRRKEGAKRFGHRFERREQTKVSGFGAGGFGECRSKRAGRCFKADSHKNDNAFSMCSCPFEGIGGRIEYANIRSSGTHVRK